MLPKLASASVANYTADDGFDDDVQRTITENAATLKFNDGEFES